MALTPEQIYGLRVRSGMDAFRPMEEHWQGKDDDATYRFARAIEAEVRKQDTELIRQMLDALENSSPHTDRSFAWKDGKWQNQRTAAIAAARARLGGKP